MTSAYSATTEQLLQLAGTAMTGLEDAKRAIFNNATKAPSTPTVNLDYDAELRPLRYYPADARKPPTKVAIPDFKDPKEKKGELDAAFNAFMNTYFPSLSAGLKNQPEEWLLAVINGIYPYGTELHDLAMAAVWQRARDRQIATNLSTKNTLRANASAHGFMLPNGALLAATLQMEKKGADMLGELNIEVMVRDATFRKEILLFAVEQAAKIKMDAHRVLTDWYKTWAGLYGDEMAEYELTVRAAADFQNAMSKYWDVELAIERLNFEIEEAIAKNKHENVHNNIDAVRAVSQDSGLGQAAQAYGVAVGQTAGAAGTLTAQVESL